MEATHKQISFIESLAQSRRLEDKDEADLREALEAGMTKRDASQWITWLKAQPWKPKGETAPDPEEGVYIVDGTIYRVRIAKSSGRPYAMILIDPASKDWQYVGRKPFRVLTDETKLTLEEAKAHGLQFGWCLQCGANLSVELSVEAGIGPVCAKRLGVSQKELAASA